MGEVINPPSGPTEQDVREHFAGQLPDDAKLIRPAYTSIWALEDYTLLWDWRNGYANLNGVKKCPCCGQSINIKCS